MTLIDPQGNYPRYIGDLMLEHPEWSTGDALPDGWHEVLVDELPEIPQDETFVENPLELVDGVYRQTYSTRPLTAEELANQKAPKTATQKLKDLGFTDAEIMMIKMGLIG